MEQVAEMYDCFECVRTKYCKRRYEEMECPTEEYVEKQRHLPITIWDQGG